MWRAALEISRRRPAIYGWAVLTSLAAISCVGLPLVGLLMRRGMRAASSEPKRPALPRGSAFLLEASALFVSGVMLWIAGWGRWDLAAVLAGFGAVGTAWPCSIVAIGLERGVTLGEAARIAAVSIRERPLAFALPALLPSALLAVAALWATHAPLLAGSLVFIACAAVSVGYAAWARTRAEPSESETAISAPVRRSVFSVVVLSAVVLWAVAASPWLASLQPSVAHRTIAGGPVAAQCAPCRGGERFRTGNASGLEVELNEDSVSLEVADGGGAGEVALPFSIRDAQLIRRPGGWELAVRGAAGRELGVRFDDRGVRLDDGLSDRIRTRLSEPLIIATALLILGVSWLAAAVQWMAAAASGSAPKPSFERKRAAAMMSSALLALSVTSWWWLPLTSLR